MLAFMSERFVYALPGWPWRGPPLATYAPLVKERRFNPDGTPYESPAFRAAWKVTQLVGFTLVAAFLWLVFMVPGTGACIWPGGC